MRTVRSSGHISGGGVYLVRGGGVPGPRGVYLVPGGCTWSQGVHLVRGGVPSPRGVYLVPAGLHLVPGGVPGPREGTWSGTPPCGQTHSCKKITFATSLRTVTSSPSISCSKIFLCRNSRKFTRPSVILKYNVLCSFVCHTKECRSTVLRHSLVTLCADWILGVTLLVLITNGWISILVRI